MKRIYKSLALITVAFLGTYVGGYAQTSTYNYTGGTQTYTVPAGINAIAVDVQGAQGGAAGPAILGTTTPGCGGRVQAVMTVSPGQVLTINVGGVGGTGTGTAPAAGGYPNGGSSAVVPGATATGGGGGGGRSEIIIAGTRMVIAGGGGGAGYDQACDTSALTTPDQPGGNGGGITGATASTCDGTLEENPTTFVTDAGGGTDVSGGAAGNVTGYGFVAGTNGGPLAGGNCVAGGYIGGGGGDGYYGGGGGCAMGGGGGSSYTDPSISSFTHTQGFNCAAGKVVICPLPNAGVITGPTAVCSGSTIPLANATGTPGGIWASGSSGIASVNSTSGAVTGGAIPTTIPAVPVTITYTATNACGSTSANYIVTVNPVPAAITGPVHKACAFVIGGPTNYSFVLSDGTTGGVWTSSNSLIASVNPYGTGDPFGNGTVTGIAGGTATISYSLGACPATTVVTINLVPNAIVTPIPAAICVSGSNTVTDVTTGGFWSSSSTGVAVVNSTSGLVTGVASGNTLITYTASDGCFIYATIHVNPTPDSLASASSLTGPVIFPPATQICQGDTLILHENILVAGSTWASSSPSIATTYPIAGYGTYVVASPTLVGPTTISYTIAGCPAAVLAVTVNPNPTPIMGVTNICSGFATLLSDLTPLGTWVSSNTSVVQIGSASGIATADTSAVGEVAIISYILTTTGCLTTAPVNVSLGADTIIGPDSVCQGASTLMIDSSAGGTWSSTHLAIAQVIATTGVTNGITAGVVNISYTLSSGCYATKVFTVSPLVPAFVVVSNSPSDSVCAGTPIAFTASPVSGGIAPDYAWYRFETPIIDTLGDTTRILSSAGTSTYRDSSTTHGDVIIVKMTVHGVCAVSNTVYDTVALNIYPVVTPAITITTTSDTSVPYFGYIATLYSSVDDGGPRQTYQWYVNRLPIPGATASTYAPTIYVNDTFYCVVSGNPICSADSLAAIGVSNAKIFTVNHLIKMGVNPLSNGYNNLALFPNPNTGSFVLTGTVNDVSGKAVYFEVSDILGRIVYSGGTTPQNGVIHEQMALDNIAAGTYLLRVHTDVGTEVLHFVVNK